MGEGGGMKLGGLRGGERYVKEGGRATWGPFKKNFFRSSCSTQDFCEGRKKKSISTFFFWVPLAPPTTHDHPRPPPPALRPCY